MTGRRSTADELIGVGLGLPGPIHLSSGKVGLSAILSGWVGLTVADEMSRRLRVPVHVDNDANLAALAELRWGAGQGYDTLVYLKVSTGIGAGLVVSGRLFRGVGGTAGEIGHVRGRRARPICRCGSRGCLETVAGARAIVDLLRPSFGPDLTIDGVLERAQQGDPACRRADHRRRLQARRLPGQRLQHLESQPDRRRRDARRRAQRRCSTRCARPSHRRAIPSAGEDVEIAAAVLGDRAELLGAVALVLHETEGRPPPPPETPEPRTPAPRAVTKAHRSGRTRSSSNQPSRGGSTIMKSPRIRAAFAGAGIAAARADGRRVRRVERG